MKSKTRGPTTSQTNMGLGCNLPGRECKTSVSVVGVRREPLDGSRLTGGGAVIEPNPICALSLQRAKLFGYHWQTVWRRQRNRHQPFGL